MLTADEWQIVGLTLGVAARAMAFALPLAVLAALLLSRTRFLGRSLFDATLHLPRVLPPVVVGLMLLLLFGLRGPAGALLHDWFGIRLVFTVQGVALACAVMVFPMMVSIIRLSLDGVDRGLENAARILGAGALDRFFTITLPLAAPGVLVAGIVGFTTCLGEFGAVITFAGSIPGETETLPLAIYAAIHSVGGEAVALRLSMASIGLALGGLLAADWLGRLLRARVGQ